MKEELDEDEEEDEVDEEEQERMKKRRDEWKNRSQTRKRFKIKVEEEDSDDMTVRHGLTLSFYRDLSLLCTMRAHCDMGESNEQLMMMRNCRTRLDEVF